MKGYRMSIKFQTRQHEVLELEKQIYQARKSKNWDLHKELESFYFELKEWQKTDVKANWGFIVALWFETNNHVMRLRYLQDHGIIKIQVQTNDRTRFITQKHDVRTPITKAKELRFWTYWRDNAQCIYCSQGLDKTTGQIDHIIPISAWPAEFMFLAEDISNLAASCRTCNLKKLNYLQLPDKELLHVEIDTCLPTRSKITDTCSEQSTGNCEICNSPNIKILCNVHGLINKHLCKLTALKNYLGHN